MFRKIAFTIMVVLCFLMVIPAPAHADSIVDSGVTLPASPVIGQQFIHTPTGRTILYTYDGTSWKAERSYGTITMYVSTTGTDDLAHGTGTGSSAFRTIQYAWDAVPPYYDGTVTINVGAGTFAESVVFTGKNGNYSLIAIQGTMTQLMTGTATGGAQGATSTAPSVTGTFTARSNEGKLLHFTSGANNGQYRIIGYTTTTTMYLDGMSLNAAPSGMTYEVLDWATTISGGTQFYDQRKMRVYDLKFTTTSGQFTTAMWGDSEGYMERCWVSNPVGTSFGVWVSSSGASWGMNYNYLTGPNYLLRVDNNGHCEPQGCKFNGTTVGILATNGGVISGMLGCEISGSLCGIQLFHNSTMELSQGNNYSYIHGCTYPLNVNTGSGIAKYGSLVEGKQINNSTVDANTTSDVITAATFGWSEN